jgi:hypothetical protein
MHLLLCNLPQLEGVIHQNHREEEKKQYRMCAPIHIEKNTMMKKQPTLQELRKCNYRKKENCECKNPSRLTIDDISKDAYNQSNCSQSKN